MVLFHTVWVLWVDQIYSWMRTLGEATLVYALVNVRLRLSIWVLPVFLDLRWVDAEEPLAARGTDRDSGRFSFR